MTCVIFRSLPSLNWASRFTLLLAPSLLVVFAMASPALGVQQQFNNGQINDLTTSIGRAAISNGTRLNVFGDGGIRAASGGGDIIGATVSDTSVISLSGTGRISVSTGDGNATAVVLNESAQLSITGGTISASSASGLGTAVIANDDSNVDFSAGSLAFVSFEANGNSSINVSGGSNSSGRFTANDDSNINVSGGSNSFANFNSNGNSTFTVSGGDFSTGSFAANDFSNFIISGGETARSVTANDEGTIVILGSNFNLDLGEVTGTDGTISGDLLDGTSFNFEYQRGSQASIVLASVPEPSSLATLTLAGVFLGFRRKRLRN